MHRRVREVCSRSRPVTRSINQPGPIGGMRMRAFRTDCRPDVPALRARLDQDGFACIDNAVSEAWLQQAQSDVEQQVRRYGANFFSVIRPSRHAIAAARDLAEDPLPVALLRDLSLSACPRGVQKDEGIYDVLRVAAGGQTGGTLEFHYDFCVVTMIVPICGAGEDDSGAGALVVLPNTRPFRRSLLVNLAEKMLIRLRRKQLADKVRKDLDSYTRKLQPGNAYLFWGYRTCHANLASANGATRATMLLHFGNPHRRSLLLKGMRTGRAVVEWARRDLHRGTTTKAG